MLPMPLRSTRCLAAALLLALGACGKDGIADIASDRGFQGGKAYPVHPPRGERKKVRRTGAVAMQSDPIECNGAGEVVHANVQMHISAPQGAIVGGTCLLRLVNVDLVANDGVVMDGGQLVMVGGSIKAQGVGIRAKGEARVELTGVEIEGATGIEASDRSRITTEGGRIKGSGAALAARGQAKVVLQGTPLEGPMAKDETTQVTVVDAPNGESD